MVGAHPIRRQGANDRPAWGLKSQCMHSTDKRGRCGNRQDGQSSSKGGDQSGHWQNLWPWQEVRYGSIVAIGGDPRSGRSEGPIAGAMLVTDNDP